MLTSQLRSAPPAAVFLFVCLFPPRRSYFGEADAKGEAARAPLRAAKADQPDQPPPPPGEPPPQYYVRARARGPAPDAPDAPACARAHCARAAWECDARCGAVYALRRCAALWDAHLRVLRASAHVPLFFIPFSPVSQAQHGAAGFVPPPPPPGPDMPPMPGPAMPGPGYNYGADPYAPAYPAAASGEVAMYPDADAAAAAAAGWGYDAYGNAVWDQNAYAAAYYQVGLCSARCALRCALCCALRCALCCAQSVLLWWYIGGAAWHTEKFLVSRGSDVFPSPLPQSLPPQMYPGQQAPPPPPQSSAPNPRGGYGSAAPTPDTASALLAQAHGGGLGGSAGAKPNIFARGAGSRATVGMDDERRRQIQEAIDGGGESADGSAAKGKKKDEAYMECYAGCGSGMIALFARENNIE